MGCQPEGVACTNYIIQYALALVLKESFKIYCAINDGIINLVDMFFDMSKHDAVKALNIYKRAGQQAEFLAEFYEFCKRLDLARNFQFPTLRQPPPSFLATMEEYVREAPQTGSVSKRLEYQEREESPEKSEEPEDELIQEEEEEEEPEEEPEPEPEPEPELPLISTEDDLLGLQEINPNAAELEESNALALAIIPPGAHQSSGSNALTEFSGTSGWELALVSTPSNINNTPPQETKLAGGFDNLLLNSLYEDETARRQLQMQNAGYGPYGMGAGATQTHNPYEQQNQQHDPFFMSNTYAPPTNVQMAMSQQQQQHMMMQPQYHQQQQLPSSQSTMMVPYQNSSPNQYPQQQNQPIGMGLSTGMGMGMGMGSGAGMGASNPFRDSFSALPQNTTPHCGNHGLL